MKGTPSVAEQATEWFVRQDVGSLDAAEQERFERWLQQPAHARAYEQVRTLCADVASLPEVFPSPVRQLRSAVTAKWVVQARMAAVALAACLAIAVIAPHLWLQWRADVTTAVGQMKTVSLPDGSSVTLNTDSALAFNFTDDRRTVQLITGEAEFEVAADARRPFVVEASGGSTRALGTVFNVRTDDDDVRVTAIEHTIEVTSPGVQSKQVLHPGQQVQYGPAGALTVANASPSADAWRRGVLVVENRPLSDVVNELNRYHRGHIQLLGSGVGELRVNGVFPLTDVRASIRALEESLGLEAMRFTDYFVVMTGPAKEE